MSQPKLFTNFEQMRLSMSVVSRFANYYHDQDLRGHVWLAKLRSHQQSYYALTTSCDPLKQTCSQPIPIQVSCSPLGIIHRHKSFLSPSHVSQTPPPAFKLVTPGTDTTGTNSPSHGSKMLGHARRLPIHCSSNQYSLSLMYSKRRSPDCCEHEAKLPGDLLADYGCRPRSGVCDQCGGGCVDEG
jgi:hypothetical protein